MNIFVYIYIRFQVPLPTEDGIKFISNTHFCLYIYHSKCIINLSTLSLNEVSLIYKV